MRKGSFKLWGLLLLVALFMTGVGGCGGGGGSDTADTGGGVVNVAVLGNLSGEGQDLAENAGMNIAQFDETATESCDNLIITQEAWSGIENQSPAADAIRAVYRTGEGRVVLQNPSHADIVRLGELLGVSPMYEGPDGSSYDYYGFGRQSDGDEMIFAHVRDLNVASTTPEADLGEDDGGDPEPGYVSPDEDMIPHNNRVAHANLAGWLFDETAGTRTSGETRLAADGSPNLLDLAKQYIVTLSSALGGKSSLINHYITSAHSFGAQADLQGDEPDIYYVHQECILDGSNNYVSEWAGTNYTTIVDGNKWYIGQGDVVDNYVEQYNINNSLALGGASVVNVQLLDPEPTAVNQQSSKTVTSGFTIGGNLGVGYSAKEGANASAGLSMGASFTSSYTYNVSDVTIKQILSASDNSPWWVHNFKIPAQNTAAFQWQHLFPPADLSHSVYKPDQVWVWRFKTADRAKIGSFGVGLQITRGAVLSRYSGSQDPLHLTKQDSAGIGTVTLPKPPLLALDKDSFTFDNKVHDDATSFVTVGAYGGNYTAQSGASWVTATKNGSQLFIQVTANATGASRTANVTVTRTGSNPAETAVITVTQLK
ncbi:MAG: BACON domain-containing protein [Synergistaceae bacterium]|jgi:hypothetical protein|nr:BACON domain-containing protein [Synergistaceae bacterium]